MRGDRYREPRKTLNLDSKNDLQNNAWQGMAKHEAEVELFIEEGKTSLILRRRVAYFLLLLFALNTVSALAVIFLVGLGKMILPNVVIISLIGETVAYAAAMFFTVTKHLFPSNKS
jgi:hypothetical protein